jgi:hypothetical protein
MLGDWREGNTVLDLIGLTVGDASHRLGKKFNDIDVRRAFPAVAFFQGSAEGLL